MEISPKVHLLRIPFQVPIAPGKAVDRFVNVFVVLGASTWIIDTGVAGSHPALIRLVEGLGRSTTSIEHVILTHGHVDHIGAAKALRDATSARVYAHAGERHWIENIDTQFRDRPIPGFHTLVEASVPIDRELTDGERLVIAPESTLSVVHCPGHSPGSIALVLEPEAVVLAGDVVPVPGDMPVYDDPIASLESLRRLRSLDPLACLLSAWDEPRHGSEALAAIDRAIAFIDSIHSAVRAVASRLTPAEPIEFCRAVLRELGLPEAFANPLVLRTFVGHYALRDRDTLIG
jgi:glyoxylase-like metal-dependent hydrolase (beta-lactamase superfamily II)